MEDRDERMVCCMAKYQVKVCREVWGTIEVEAASRSEAEAKVSDHDYESEFEPYGEIGHQSVYGAVPV